MEGYHNCSVIFVHPSEPSCIITTGILGKKVNDPAQWCSHIVCSWYQSVFTWHLPWLCHYNKLKSSVTSYLNWIMLLRAMHCLFTLSLHWQLTREAQNGKMVISHVAVIVPIILNFVPKMLTLFLNACITLEVFTCSIYVLHNLDTILHHTTILVMI